MSRAVAVGIALILLTAVPASADDFLWLVSTSFNYSSGDYGTGKDTTLIYVPLTLGVRPIERFTVSLTIPYIRQSTQTVVVTGGGVAVRRDKEAQLKTSRSSVTKTEDGLGDLLLKGEYVVLQERTFMPETSGYLKIKFPTADEDRGLGTGKFDETVGVNLSKALIERLYGYLGLGYTFIGSPSGTQLHDSFGWSVGTAYAVTTPFSVFGFLDGATAISPGKDGPLEGRVGAEYKLTKAMKVTGSVTKGFSNGSPDWGISAGLAFRF
jgi:hypothetical protein